MDVIRSLILRRDGLVILDDARPRHPPALDPETLVDLSARLAELGFVLSRELHLALRALPDAALASTSAWLINELADELGANRSHVPLFRQFPEGVPQDSLTLYVARVIAWLLQSPEQPCLFCGETHTVAALDPCGHLICSACWDGQNYSACPLCNRRIAANSPFIKPAAPRPPGSSPGRPLRLLHLGRDLTASAQRLFARLVSRASPLSPKDRDALNALLTAYNHRLLETLPAAIPVKETTALVFGGLLRAASKSDAIVAAARPHLRTATDVLRVICVFMGAGPDLIEPPKPYRSLPRALRRAFLEALERLDPLALIEDVLRHAELWKRVAERLHPFENAARHPNAALAFAILRRSNITEGTPLGDLLLAAARPLGDRARLENGQIRFRSWGGVVERALLDKNIAIALPLLAQRPGDLLRRADHVLRVAESRGLAEQAIHALAAAARRGAPAMLLTLRANLRGRQAPLKSRIFFPKGNVAKAKVDIDARPPLAPDTITSVARILEDELLHRASQLPPVERALLDAELASILVPFAERTSARALVPVPRGSSFACPAQMRLFVHWSQPDDKRVDLDHSVALFDDAWDLCGQCSYTNLSEFAGAAVHSGDLTSAPPPEGASEFIDLDLERLASFGVRCLASVIFSFNDVAFDELPDAFAGFLEHHGPEGEIFDPRKVAQRFELRGETKIAIPMLVDVRARRLWWIDVTVPPSTRSHNIESYRSRLEALSQGLVAHFEAGTRPTMWELCCLHAAARAATVEVRDRAAVARFRRRPSETLASFYRRLLDKSDNDGSSARFSEGPQPALFAGLRDDAPLPDGSQAYALRFDALSAARVARLAASDLVTPLVPR